MMAVSAIVTGIATDALFGVLLIRISGDALNGGFDPKRK